VFVENVRLHTMVAVVDQYRAALQERAVPFKRQVQHGVEERVSGTNECRARLSLGRDERLQPPSREARFSEGRAM